MRSMKKIVSCILCLTLVIATALGISSPVMATNDSSNNVEQIKEEEIYGAGSSFGEATDISVNEVVTDNLESNKDINYYKFSTDTDGYVSFDFNHGYVDGNYRRWVLEFYNLDQKKMFTEEYYGNVDESKTITTQNAGIPAGTYYVCIKPYNTWEENYSTTIYHFCVNYVASSSWETEFNDVFSEADYIQTDNDYYGTTMTNKDNDYYCFNIQSDGYIKILFKHDYIDGNYRRWNVTLFDDNEKKLISKDYYGNVPEGTTVESCNVGLPRGKYYVKVMPYNTWDENYSTGNYNFCISYTSNDNYETEWNDLFSSSDLLTSGQTIMGNQMTNKDDDYYYFENTQNGVVIVDFSHDYADGNYRKWSVSLYNENESQIWKQDIYGNNTDIFNNESWLEAGKYYIKVSPYNTWDENFSIVPYYLTVNFDDSGDGTSATMYRLYNPNSGEHFYTSNISERNNLTNLGWKYEGVAWHAPFESGEPVYRLYNPNTGDHHYTTDGSERDHLSSVGWKYEGIGWYSDESEGVALHRLYNPNATGAGSHHYTTNMEEANNLTRIGWKYEGIGWYGV